MKLGIVVPLLLLNFCHRAVGQDSLSYNKEPFRIVDASTKSKKTNRPALIIKADNRAFKVVSRDNFASRGKVKKTIKQLNPDWISSIDVLKGNSAAEKYGSLGQNGVVIVNLKEGTLGKLPRKLKKHEITEKS